MTDPIDDLVNALNMQVKEETIKRYMQERLILEEELKEYAQEFESAKKLYDEIIDLNHSLGCLLVGYDNLIRFWQLLGFKEPPFPEDTDSEGFGNPVCPLEITPRGFFKKARYIDLVVQMYGVILGKTKDCLKKANYLNELAKVINRDIDKFHLNYDLLSIITFLKSLDANTLLRKEILGSNFGGTEMAALEKRMMFRKIDIKNAPPPSCPKLPPRREVHRLTADFLGEVFSREKKNVLPVLTKSRS